MAIDFTKFTSSAQERQLFIAQLIDWDQKITALGKDSSSKSDFKAGGTNLYDLAPVMPRDFATGIQAHEVLPLLRNLRPKPIANEF